MGPFDVLRGGRGDRDAGPGRAGDRHQRGVGCAISAAPVSRSPQTTLHTPGGKNSCIFSTIQYDEAGVVSDGLSTTVLPAASAGANFQTAIIIG